MYKVLLPLGAELHLKFTFFSSLNIEEDFEEPKNFENLKRFYLKKQKN
jgi:hypothetical protein